MSTIFDLCDELGPAKVVHVYEPSVNLKAVVVIDNVARGPSIGGVRMATDVSALECARLARAMTFKNAAAGLPHGGGKAVLYGDPKMPPQEKQTLLRAMASSMRDIEEYIFAPDMGTDEECMAWVRDEIGRVVALPREVGGIPLDEIGATAWGIRHATEVALEYCDFPLAGARVVIQGFGAVGTHSARFLCQQGAVLVGVSDSQGAVYNNDGLDVEALIALKESGKSVYQYNEGTRISQQDLIGLPCDIWIPAARPDVIHKDNVEQLQARLVIQGANIPCTPEAEKRLHEKGVLCVPDFIANAGGVICAAMEYQGASEGAAMEAIAEKVARNTRQVLQQMKQQQILPREAATNLATQRVKKAMSYRRFSLRSTAPRFI